MKTITIIWNNSYDNGLGHRNSTIRTNKDKSTNELLIGWMTANGRNIKDLIIHRIIETIV